MSNSLTVYPSEIVPFLFNYVFMINIVSHASLNKCPCTKLVKNAMMCLFTFMTLLLCKTKAVMRELGKLLITADILRFTPLVFESFITE